MTTLERAIAIPSRIPDPTPQDHARLEEYRQVRAILLDGVAATSPASLD